MLPVHSSWKRTPAFGSLCACMPQKATFGDACDIYVQAWLGHVWLTTYMTV